MDRLACSVLSISILLAPGYTRADLIRLKSGDVLEGRITRETLDEVWVLTRTGETSIARSDIEAVETYADIDEVLNQFHRELLNAMNRFPGPDDAANRTLMTQAIQNVFQVKLPKSEPKHEDTIDGCLGQYIENLARGESTFPGAQYDQERLLYLQGAKQVLDRKLLLATDWDDATRTTQTCLDDLRNRLVDCRSHFESLPRLRQLVEQAAQGVFNGTLPRALTDAGNPQLLLARNLRKTDRVFPLDREGNSNANSILKAAARAVFDRNSRP
ncbi:MAG: hypothetical protein HY722_05225 [Planctomycetes bacterium]|nr:hypothetical protein [Planctomycetota bacterium]